MTQIKLIFSVFGNSFDPNHFSELTKVLPTSFWFKGDNIPNRASLIRQETCWEYSFGFLQTLYLDEIAHRFVQLFSPNMEEIVKYIKNNKLETKIDVVVEIVNDEKPALSFDKEFLNMIVKMNGEIDVDLYYFDE